MKRKLGWAVGKKRKVNDNNEDENTEIQRNSNYNSVLRRNEARSHTIKKMNEEQDKVMREQGMTAMSTSDKNYRIRDVEELTTNSEKYLENLKPASVYDQYDKSSYTHNIIGD